MWIYLVIGIHIAALVWFNNIPSSRSGNAPELHEVTPIMKMVVGHLSALGVSLGLACEKRKIDGFQTLTP